MTCGRINISGLFQCHFSLQAVLGFANGALSLFCPLREGRNPWIKKEGPSSERQCALRRHFVFIIPVPLPLQTSAALQVTFLTHSVDGWGNRSLLCRAEGSFLHFCFDIRDLACQIFFFSIGFRGRFTLFCPHPKDLDLLGNEQYQCGSL